MIFDFQKTEIKNSNRKSNIRTSPTRNQKIGNWKLKLGVRYHPQILEMRKPKTESRNYKLAIKNNQKSDYENTGYPKRHMAEKVELPVRFCVPAEENRNKKIAIVNQILELLPLEIRKLGTGN